MGISESLAKAVPLHRKGDLDGAEKIYVSVLEKHPGCPDALHLFGLLKRQRGKTAEAITILEKACFLDPANGRFLIDCADCLHETKAFEKALHYYNLASAALPGNGSIHFKMAGLYHLIGDVKAARESLKKTLAVHPDHFEALINFAELLRMEKEYSQAISFVEKALALKPDFAKGHHCAGLVYQALGNFKKALYHFQEAIRLDESLVIAHIDLGIALQATGDFGAAIASYRRALIVKPDCFEAYFNLANCLRETDHFDDALLCFQAALKVNPSSVQGLTNYGEALLAVGRVLDSERQYSQSVKISEEKCSQAFSNLLLCMNYNPDYSPRQIYEKHLEFGRAFNELSGVPENRGKVRGTLKKLHVGYISPDFCNHPVTQFLEPMLFNHDTSSFEIFCYSDVAKPDAVTERLKNTNMRWREIYGLEDNCVKAAIGEDHIDILVDCSGHTAGNRLQLFAKKPAPLQISYLGYPTTTGLAAMDYYITDALLDHIEDSSLYTEKLLRIEPCFCCFLPNQKAPDVGDLPAAQNGFITFGSLHTLARLNDRVIELWSRLLNDFPTSRLCIIRNTLTGTTRKNLETRFSQHNIDLSRIELTNEIPAAGHLSLYHEIDILLDTFPWSGHTTACESLWMGVPVVSLYGDRHAGRMVSSILETMGLGDWVAHSTEDYRAIAIKKASAIDELKSLRGGLRGMIEGSEVCNAKKFTRKLEAVYKKVWSENGFTI